MPRLSLLDRFKQYIVIGESDDCWPWVGYKTDNGYGQFRLPHRTVKAHRLAFVLFHAGHWPSATSSRAQPQNLDVDALLQKIAGQDLDHTCDSRYQRSRDARVCCNPSHLRPMDPVEHARRHARTRKPGVRR